MLSEKRSSMLHGILLITLFSSAVFYTGDMGFIKSLLFSPMIVDIILGMLYADSLRNNLPDTWAPGILFCSKRILRIGIILYGFRLTFQDVTTMGLPIILTDAIIVTVTACGGALIDKPLKMDRSITLPTSVGSDVCGATTVLGAESAINTKPYKIAVVVSTVVIFGMLSMFLYPVLYRNGVSDLSPELMGLSTGSIAHEVAHVVGVGNAMEQGVSNTVIIVKMIRVMMLVSALLVIGWTVARNLIKRNSAEQAKGKITTPWFATLFLVVIGFNPFNLLPVTLVERINQLDTSLLTMAMTALGAEANFGKFKKAGTKPFLLAATLSVQLIGGGYCLAKYIIPMLMNI